MNQNTYQADGGANMSVDDRAMAAPRDLQEGGLVQLLRKCSSWMLIQNTAVDLAEDLIMPVKSEKEVDSDAIAGHITRSPLIYSFYHYPGSDSVIFISTPSSDLSVKMRIAHIRVRNEAMAAGEKGGLTIAKKVYCPLSCTS
ncbi:Actin-binding cofilin/tropomyosin type [Penicillium alfredii]|uniref:Actin-binding cofilin/tropomyosin type n=1 Tax=Penicillium alfredii TaxID=1506179 RepID=A0A9W9KD27_9EURO|nr:Actin-binding cofilin/tropomyosin type [Penicillium alfredii]KAJ5101371.1 Actin-binding cofilin/tropomyosin type [Penicillium alfredii]